MFKTSTLSKDFTSPGANLVEYVGEEILSEAALSTYAEGLLASISISEANAVIGTMPTILNLALLISLSILSLNSISGECRVKIL